jgi:hypothetical protein
MFDIRKNGGREKWSDENKIMGIHYDFSLEVKWW